VPEAQSAFVSYSRDDSEFALRLTQDLRAAGAKVWLDQLDIQPGNPWDNAIEAALNDAPQMLLVLSPSSAKSENVRNEISYALEQGKIIIPVLYQDCTVPLRLQRTQRIDFRADYARGLSALMAHLHVAQPDKDVLDKAAEDEARRRAAWQARESEVLRLRQLNDEKLREQDEPDTKPTHSADFVQNPPEQPPIAPPRQDARSVALAQQELLRRRAQEQEQWLRQQARETEQRLRDEAPYASASASPPQMAPRPQTAAMAGRPTSLMVPAIVGGLVFAVLMIAIAVYLLRPKPPSPEPGPMAPIVQLQPPTPSVANPTPTSNADLLNKQGDGYFNRKDYKDAAPLYQQACDAGQSFACTSIGYLYSQGYGVLKNPTTAVADYQKACNGGDAMGCRDLGNHVRDGDGAPRNPQLAAIYFLQSCNGGDGTGCRNLAILYDGGSPIGTDLAKAKVYYDKGCELKDQASCDAAKNAKFN